MSDFWDYYDLASLINLVESMKKCNMMKLPKPTGDVNGRIGYHDDVCSVCLNTYLDHPMDPRVIGYGDAPFLNILCNGERVKL